jgi:glycosyltransferase involved in cell wall biosynthesis
MDYLIGEISAMGEERPYLVMLGESENETEAVRATAQLLLGSDGFVMRTVPKERMDDYYRAADVFALASLTEAFGLAYVEAMSHGLPCIAHDQEVTRFVLGQDGKLVDLRERGALTSALRRALDEGDTTELRARRHNTMRERFGWPALLPGYVSMLTELEPSRQSAKMARPATAEVA